MGTPHAIRAKVSIAQGIQKRNRHFAGKKNGIFNSHSVWKLWKLWIISALPQWDSEENQRCAAI